MDNLKPYTIEELSKMDNESLFALANENNTNFDDITDYNESYYGPVF